MECSSRWSCFILCQTWNYYFWHEWQVCSVRETTTQSLRNHKPTSILSCWIVLHCHWYATSRVEQPLYWGQCWIASLFSMSESKNLFSTFDKQKLVPLAQFYLVELSTLDLMALDNQLETYIINMRSNSEFSKVNGMSNLSQKMVEMKNTFFIH